MIYEHVISIESCSNSFTATCGFNTKEKTILIKWNVQYEWYNGKKNTR
jgi:hypothetical protein